jgi:hypothetical protein
LLETDVAQDTPGLVACILSQLYGGQAIAGFDLPLREERISDFLARG